MLSLLIACMELLFLINLLIFAEKNKLNIIAELLIFNLMLYQLLEFFICRTGTGNSWIIYVAFSTISFLPPLALLFVLNVKGVHHKLLKLIFIPPIFFTIFYLFYLNDFHLIECNIFYSVYKYPLGDFFGLFYYIPVLISIVLLIIEVIKNKRVELVVVLFGFLFMSFPVALGFILKLFGDSSLIAAIVSVMCKSAFLFAFSIFYFSLYNRSNKKNE